MKKLFTTVLAVALIMFSATSALAASPNANASPKGRGFGANGITCVNNRKCPNLGNRPATTTTATKTADTSEADEVFVCPNGNTECVNNGDCINDGQCLNFEECQGDGIPKLDGTGNKGQGQGRNGRGQGNCNR